MVDVKEALNEYGEISVVLESGAEYELHLYDTKFATSADGSVAISTEGMHEGEYKEINFPQSAVEHYSIHYET